MQPFFSSLLFVFYFYERLHIYVFKSITLSHFSFVLSDVGVILRKFSFQNSANI